VLHIFAIILNLLVLFFYIWGVGDAIVEEFQSMPLTMKYFFSITFGEFFFISLFMFILPILNIKFIFGSK
jgi:hypothetical protein